MDEHFEHSVDFDLLGKFAAGEASPEERLNAQAWIDASDENRQTWEALQSIWEHAPNPAERETVDIDAAWDRVKKGVSLTEDTPRSTTGTGTNWQIFRIAAALVVAVGLSLAAWYFVGRKGAPTIEQLTLVAKDGILQDTLQDGTVVTLNVGARLEYPSDFQLAQREVKLQGEAFFDVARDVQHPFVIHAGAADVRVLGTSFNVRSTADEVAVVVATGKVELSAETGNGPQAVILHPGNAGTFDRKAQALEKKTQAEGNALFWKDRRLVYKGTPFSKVVAELQALFDVQIVIDAAAHGNCPLNTEFENQSIESILNIIAETFNLEMTQDENTFTYSGTGCQ